MPTVCGLIAGCMTLVREGKAFRLSTLIQSNKCASITCYKPQAILTDWFLLRCWQPFLLVWDFIGKDWKAALRSTKTFILIVRLKRNILLLTLICMYLMRLIDDISWMILWHGNSHGSLRSSRSFIAQFWMSIWNNDRIGFGWNSKDTLLDRSLSLQGTR